MVDAVSTHPKHSMLGNSKYSQSWEVLKETGTICFTVFDKADKAKVVRGISQLKNIDLAYKRDNYYKRIKVTTISEERNAIVIQLTLINSLKYRNGKF